MTAALPCRAALITVDDDGPADFNNIQAAIDYANHRDTVVVKPGLYSGHGNRDIDFQGKAITLRSRDGPRTSVIDCASGSEWEWHRAVAFVGAEGRDSVLDGFTIVNGQVIGCGAYPGGGAILCVDSSPTIRNCRVSANRAAAICAAPDSFGGGISCLGGSPLIANCVISGNSAVNGGGGIWCAGGAPVVINCTITGNAGYGINCSSDSNPAISNCILWDNQPGQMRVYKRGFEVAFSDVEGGWPGRGNIDADPCFAVDGFWDVDPLPQPRDVWAEGDYHLKSQAGRRDLSSRNWIIDDMTSPCIDAGNPMNPLGHEPFPSGGLINMGAYGGTAEASKSWFAEPPCEIIVAGDINGDCSVDLLDFAILAMHWLDDNSGRPTVQITAPEDGDRLMVGGIPPRTQILAVASDRDGQIVRVEFLVDGHEIGADTDGADAWSYEWRDYSLGIHTLTARAWDNHGLSATSRQVQVEVWMPWPPPP
ncbi:MAG: right-handed parallel beta-helix repeat-containing protein [Phycisphaerales bacterium]|nr:MAG: right-handed parallel beta-helix repeat-containing protein [Phycisphaerales bacterium]